MKNDALRNELKEIVGKKANITGLTKDIRGNLKPSIELVEIEPFASVSYLYKNEADRDADFIELEKALK